MHYMHDSTKICKDFLRITGMNLSEERLNNVVLENEINTRTEIENDNNKQE